jgi:hypothetical protein
LFAGVYGVLRKLAGHREIDYADVPEAAEAVQTVSLLMRVLDRVEVRLLNAAPGSRARAAEASVSRAGQSIAS